MPKPLTPIDFHYLVGEFKVLEKATLKNIARGENFSLEFKCADKKVRFLVVGRDFCYLTETRPEGEADGFSNFLLNHLRKKRLFCAKQVGFNKILELVFGGFSLVLEFIGKGNIILCGPESHIIGALEVRDFRDRKIRPKETYLPPPSPNPEDFKENTNEQEVAGSLHIGKEYAQEISKTKTPITDLLARPPEAGVYFDKTGEKFAAPFRLKTKDKNFEFRPTASFSEAIADVYSKKKETKGEKIKKAQEKNLQKRQKEAEKYGLEANLLFGSFDEIKVALDNWKEKKQISPPLKKINEKTGEAILEIEGSEFKIPLAEDLRKTVNLYFSRAKKAKDKIEKTLEWQKIDLAPKEKAKREVKKSAWFDQFRNFVTSDGYLVILGKDATTNEKLIKKYCKAQDIVLHAHIPGSPFAVIRSEGREVTEKAIEEAAQFTASYSRFWNSRLGIADIYWIYPEQVSKKALAGEYLAKGSFMIYGKKNFLKSELRLSIGVDEEFQVVRGVEDSLKKHAKCFVTLVPGAKSGKELGREILEKIAQLAKGEEKKEILRINPEEFLKFVPYGKGEIVDKT